jgi:hypothetical protein
MTYAESAELAVRVSELMVRRGRGSDGAIVGKIWVMEPTTRADAEKARDRRVPETVIGGPPGIRIWEPKT